MKKKFIFLAMLLLTIMGGVKWNVLNAQETITIGEGSTYEEAFSPTNINYKYTLSQQIYLAEEFGDNAGNIISFAFKNAKDLQQNSTPYTATRTLNVYMMNTTKSSFSSNTDWVNVDDANFVYTGTVSFGTKGEWVMMELNTPFAYESGSNLLLCINDITGFDCPMTSNYYAKETEGKRCIYACTDNSAYDVTYLTSYTAKSDPQYYVPQVQFTFESSAPAVMPSSVPEIVSVEATHNSVTLAWTEVENAKKYNVYTSTGDLVTTVSTTSCTIEGLNELTEYCYQVSAVNGEFETEKSTASCATTLEAPKERTLVFELKDTFGDGWNGNSLKVYFNGVLQQSYTISSGASGYYELIVPQGNVVKMVYDGSGQYQSENSFTIYYKDGTLINGQEKITGTGGSTHTVVEFVYGPVLLVEASAYDIFSDQTATLTATAVDFDGDVTYRWLLNGEEVGTESSFIFDPETIGTYTFTCVVSDSKDTKESDVTINVHESVLGKWFRVKVNQGGSYMGYYLNVNQYYTSTSGSTVGITGSKTASNMQKFTIESNGLGQYYLKSADGYYIKCETGGSWWNVHAYSTTEKTPLVFEYTDGEQFYIKDYDKMTGNSQTGDNNNPGNSYFKVENNLVYCDAPINYTGTPPNTSYLTTWIFEEINFSATAYAYNENIFDNESTTLSVTAMDGSGNYTYSWSPIDGLDDATSANPTFSPSASGTYTFTCTVTDTESNATAEASVTVNVSARPALQLTVSADKNLIYNDGEIAVLTATVTEATGYAPYTYSWTLNETEVRTEATYAFFSETVGVYTLTCTVTDARNNTQTASATIEVKDASERPLEIVLGTPGPYTAYHPTSPLYENSYSQQIYTASEINKQACDITSISFMKYNNTALSRNIKVFMLNVNKDEFTNDSDWVSVSDSDIVFEGNFDFAGNQGEWTTIDLTNKFSYTGGDILLCVNDFTGVWRNDYPQFYSYTVDSYRSLASRRDDTSFPDVMSGSANYFEKAVNHIKFGYEIPAPKPESLVATPAQIYVGETTTLTWNELEGAVSYNIYVDGVLNGNTKELTYGLSDLTYNVEPGHTIEVAAVYADATESGKASVTVQVAGTFTLTVNVTDGTNPIEGATVNVTTDQWTYDEFGNNIASLSSLLTDENGQAVFNNVKLLNPDTYCAYSISATMDVYGTHSTTPLANYESVANGGNVTRTIVMTLPEPKNITADKELYIAGEDVVLTWETPEFNTRAFLGYNVYSVMDGDYDLGTETSYTKLNEETLTETTYTIKDVEYDAKFAVSAVYDEGESSKVNANVQITAYANLVVNVKDANTLAGIDGAVVEIYSYRTGETETFVTANGGIVEEEYLLGNYTVTVKKNDSHYEVEPQEAQLVYGGVAELEFELTPKASIENVTVTADNTGYVSWTGDYAKWNVYRRNTNAPQELETVATGVTTTSTTDTEWETLEPGTYQYGVAALVEPQAQTRGTEVVFEEGFDNNGGDFPEGWDRNHTSQVDLTEVNIYKYEGAYGCFLGGSSSTTFSLTSPNINLTSGKLTLNFYNRNGFMGNTTTNINVKRTNESSWTTLETINETHSEFTLIEVDLSNYANEIIKLQFEVSCVSTGYSCIDEISIVAESSEVETQIEWSNDVVKQGPNTFEGTVSTDWNVAENWSNGVVPADGAEVTINANAVITGAVNVSNLTINNGDSYPSNKLTVANGGALTVTGLIKQESNYQLVLEEGGQIFQNNANVTARFRMSIDNPTDWSNTSNKDGWQFISMPMTDVAYDWFTGADEEYDLYKYDGSQELEWLNHKAGSFAETEFISGKGYLASLKDNTTATVYGTLNAATSQQWGPYYMYDKDFANLQLIGNPFTFDIKWSDFAISGVYYDSELEEVIDNVPYFVDGYAIVDNNGNYQYYTSADNESIKVGQGFFVKLLATQVSLKYNKTRTITRESNNSLNITATGNAGEDNVIINFAGKSEGFDKLQNFNDAIATVYVAEGGKNYGIYNCDADVQEVELSFNANKMGNYTISIEPNGKFETVTLVDRFTGVETNMLVEDYNFTAMSEENPNRFIVRFANGQQTTDNSHFVYQSGEELILNIQGEVQIVDVLGRVVYSGEAMNDINRINVSSFNSGAYMVKVMNGNEVKVEKVVIY